MAIKQRGIRATVALCILLGSLTGANPALAALIDQDWQSPGDAQLLLDTSTGLLWLDHTPTMDISYNDVTGALGTGGAFDGFRYATEAEVLHLWAEAGISDTNWEVVNIGEWTAVRNLANRLGTTSLLETTPEGGLIYGSHALGMIDGGDPGLLPDQRWVMEISYLAGGTDTRTSRNHYFRDISEHDMHYASYLVSVTAVPLPGAFWLLASGLPVLVSIARRRQPHHARHMSR
jgi:hypothetical protein